MNEEEARAAREYLNRLSAGQDEKIAALKEQLAELEAHRNELAPRTFSGDEKAKLELEDVEDEHDEIARATRVAEAAEPEFDRMIEPTKERHTHAQAQVHRANYERLLEEQEKIEGEAEELLNSYLDKQVQIRELRAKVYAEGTRAGMRLTYDAVSVAENLYERARQWEVRQ